MMEDVVRYRPVDGHPEYQIGDDGSLRVRWHGDAWRHLSPVVKGNGYVAFSLAQSNGHAHSQVMAHLLVLNAFVGPCPPSMEALHDNGVRTDARLSNLRWGTHVENERDKQRHGKVPRGERNGNYKLTTADVVQIKTMRSRGVPRLQIARQFGVTPTAIYWIDKGRQWTHVTI